MQQRVVTVMYDGVVAGDYAVGPLIEGTVTVTLRAANSSITLRATGPQICLLLNFGNPRLEIKRIVVGL